VQNPEYITRVDHAYDRTYYAGFEKMIASFIFVLKKQGWGIIDEIDPSVFERDERYENNGYQNVLIVTDTKNNFLHLTGMRLNIYIHSLGANSDVEIRSTLRNDKIVESILNGVDREINQ